MENINWSAILSGLALILSISSPMITACINNHHQLKMHKINFYYSHRAGAIERYIASVGKLIYCDNSENRTEHGKCLGEIYLYIPSELWIYVDSIENSLQRNDNGTNVRNTYKELCKKLSENNPPRLIY